MPASRAVHTHSSSSGRTALSIYSTPASFFSTFLLLCYTFTTKRFHSLSGAAFSHTGTAAEEAHLSELSGPMELCTLDSSHMQDRGTHRGVKVHRALFTPGAALTVEVPLFLISLRFSKESIMVCYLFLVWASRRGLCACRVLFYPVDGAVGVRTDRKLDMGVVTAVTEIHMKTSGYLG